MDIVSSEDAVTRKPHKCWGCATEFPKGSKLSRVTCADGGEIYSCYWCDICQEWLTRYDDGEGVDFGSLREDEGWLKIQQEMKALQPAPSKEKI